MKETRPLRGIVPVVQTPVKADQSVDVEGQKRLVNYLVNKDVGGFWILGTGSEDMNLTFEKRLTAARATCEANAGRKPLVLGAGFFCFDDIMNFIDATQELEFDAYHVMPYHPLLSHDRLAWMYREIADRAPKPVWMYTSANWCQKIGPEFVEALKGHPNITGIKFSSSNTVDQLKVLGMQSPEFQVVTAVANQMFATFSMGSMATTSSMAGPLPEPLMEVHRLFVEGEREKSLAAHRTLMKFLSAMPKGSKKDNFLTGAEEKYMLSLRGVCEPHMTGYYRPLNDSEQADVRKALDGFGYMKYIQDTRW